MICVLICVCLYILQLDLYEKPKATRRQRKDSKNRQKKVHGKAKANVTCRNISGLHYMH